MPNRRPIHQTTPPSPTQIHGALLSAAPTTPVGNIFTVHHCLETLNHLYPPPTDACHPSSCPCRDPASPISPHQRP